MTAKLHVVQNCAMSLDGCLDDSGATPLILSNAQDFDRVDRLRADCDAILVGANTIRRDDPKLRVRSEALRRARVARGVPEHPRRVTLTRSGALDPEARFFAADGMPPLVYCVADVETSLRGRLGRAAEVVAVGRGPLSATSVADDLAARGVRRLLIEGGSEVGTLFLAAGLVDELTVAIAPFFVGEPEAPRFVAPATFPNDKRRPMTLTGVERLGDVVVLAYRPRADSDATWMNEAVELSRKCPPSDAAFSVGAVLVDSSGRPIATGYSREVAGEHAEEVALERARRSSANLAGATLYSSLEPCSTRASGKTPCVRRILDAGIARVVFALDEPKVFVDGRGAETLEAAGVEVVVLGGFAHSVREVNRHLLPDWPGVAAPGGSS